MKALLAWIDDRTGLATAWRGQKERSQPYSCCAGSILPSMILFAFVVQILTGLVLWMYYSPGAQTAWESVWYLETQVVGGWLLRAVHHMAAQLMVGLIGLYLLGLIVSGGYRAPREFVFWSAMLLGMVGLGLLLTGDLLSWDQNGYWATQVRVKFLLLLPVIGEPLFKLAAGGPNFGHHTLTRFFALHAGVFSGLLLGLMVLHFYLLRRADNGLAATAPRSTWFWPNQALKNTTGWLAVLVLVGVLIGAHSWMGGHHGTTAAERYAIGLGAPADPAEAYKAARPEWAFVGLYELTHSFPGDGIGTSGISWKAVPIFVIPTILVVLFFAMPVVGRVGIGHAFNLLATVAVLGAIGVLSFLSIRHDRHNEEHQLALKEGREAALRARQLAAAPAGIPVSGALTLVRHDAKIQGPLLFKQYCAACHAYQDAQGNGIASKAAEDDKPNGAPNLYGFANAAWIGGFLNAKEISTPKYFGKTAFKEGKMAKFVKGGLKELLADEDLKKSFPPMLEVLAAEGQRTPQSAAPAEEKTALLEDFTCVDCHKFHDKGSAGNAPDLTGYGSREWLLGIISNPTHERFYGPRNDRMPAYAKDAAKPEENLLTPAQLELLVDWLRGQWFEPQAAGTP